MNTPRTKRYYCYVPQCLSTSHTSIHRLPSKKNPKLRNKWMKILKLKPQNIVLHFQVCSNHFVEADFFKKKSNQKCTVLKKNAIPSRNLPELSHTTPEINHKERDLRYANRNSKFDCNTQVKNSDEENVQENENTEQLDSQFEELLDMSLEIKVDENGNEDDELENIVLTKDANIQVNTMDDFEFNDPTFLDLIRNDSELNSWTGVSSFSCLESIVECIENIESVQLKLSSLKLSTILLIIIVLVRIKTNLSFKQMSVLFQCTSKCISKYFYDFVPILRVGLSPAMFWPTQNENKKNIPNCFKPDFIDCRAVCDCTEIEIERPITLSGRIKTYSSYKGKQTGKFQVVIAPAGLIINVSSTYGGKASDKFIFLDENLIDKFEEGDAIMVDKGYAISKETIQKGIKLLRPPFLDQPQLSMEDAIYNNKIARARVHVERAIQRIKLFKFFHDKIPITIAPYLDDIIRIVCCIVNLSNPILSDNKFS